MNIGTVIVTFNRKELLIECLNAVLGQSYLPKKIYIIDNASTDGTEELLKERGLHHGQVHDVSILYVRLPKNSGGSGGFYTGIKMADKDGCDAIWVMDDDGLPDKDCLKNLLPHLGKYDYISPLVVDIEGGQMMSFEGKTVEEFLRRAENGIVEGCANPFNGILYSKKLIDAVGYPKKEMFIWGDEVNYDLRAKAAGFQPVMVVDAIHRHPLNRQLYVRYFRNHSMVIADKDWKLFCYIRNRTYNAKLFYPLFSFLRQTAADFVKFSCYYLFQVRQPQKLSVVLNAIYKGLKSDFTGLEKYMK